MQEASTEVSQWSLEGHRPGRVVTACNLRFKGKEALIQLAPAQEIHTISSPFEPASFKGEDVPRKGISFNIPEHIRMQIELIEERVKTLLCTTWPATQWHSALKLSDRFPTSLRCKIRVKGPRACRRYDSQGTARPLPEAGQWEGARCIPIIAVGAYVGDGQAGLLLEVQALMIGERMFEPPAEFSFC